MLKLRFKTAYKSITSFPETVLPDFTVITGVNGSGKSHLLEALGQGAVKVEGLETGEANIRLFTSKTLFPKKSVPADPVQLTRERSTRIAELLARMNGSWRQFSANLKSL